MPTKPTTRRVLVAGTALVASGAFLFGVLAPPEECPEVDGHRLRRAATEAVDWFVRNQQPDGTWLYLWDARTGRPGQETYNGVRHAGAIMGLYQAAAANLKGALASADRGLEWVTPKLAGGPDWAALRERGTVPAGATALLAAGLVERRLSTDDDRHLDLLRRFGRFLAGQVEPSGAVLAYYDSTADRPMPGLYSKYYTGEAYWALTRLHRLFPDGGFGEMADRIGAYLATRRDDVEDLFPPIPDHWAAYGLAETVAFPERAASGDDGRRPLTAAEVAYARRQAGLFGSQVRWVSQRFGPWGATVRGPSIPRGGGYGVVGEGLTGIWQAAGADDRLADLRRSVGERAACMAGLAIAEQKGEGESIESRSGGEVRGAWFINGTTRMDDQQHALSALLRTIPIVAADERSDGGRPEPSAWLWLVALVAGLSPFRAALAIPRAGRSPRELAVVALAGSAAGGTVVVAAALAAEPLLDVLDVSTPALRIGVGILGALAGLADVFRRPPPAEPALPGRMAALVPVAVPLVARPPLVILGLSAGADHGVGLVAVAMALGGAVLAALASRAPSPAGERVLRWGAGLTGAALAVAGTTLVVDGVFDV